MNDIGETKRLARQLTPNLLLRGSPSASTVSTPAGEDVQYPERLNRFPTDGIFSVRDNDSLLA